MAFPELEVYRRYHLPLLYWPRVGDDPNEWKGPHGSQATGWNDPSRVYDLSKFDPSIHNIGTPTGRETMPEAVIRTIPIEHGLALERDLGPVRVVGVALQEVLGLELLAGLELDHPLEPIEVGREHDQPHASVGHAA